MLSLTGRKCYRIIWIKVSSIINASEEDKKNLYVLGNIYILCKNT